LRNYSPGRVVAVVGGGRGRKKWPWIVGWPSNHQRKLNTTSHPPPPSSHSPPPLTRYGDRIEVLHRPFQPEDLPNLRMLEIWFEGYETFRLFSRLKFNKKVSGRWWWWWLEEEEESVSWLEVSAIEIF